MKSVMIAMVISVILAIAGWIWYAQATQETASELKIATPDTVYKK